MDKCFCHLNGYEVKDAKARKILNGKIPMGNIKTGEITCKNLFDDERWYNELHKISSVSITKETVDGIEYYKFNAPEIYAYQFMKGEFKENTRYTLSCKARKYDGVDYSDTGFTVYYTDGTRTNIYIDKTLEEYDYILITDENKTVDYINLAYENNGYVLVRDIQLEEGSVATEYVPYFELVTKDDLKNVTGSSVKGYYYYEMNLQKLLFGLNGNNNNEITDINLQNVAKAIVEKITSDNVRTPHIIIANSLDTYTDSETGETVEKPAPRQIILNNLTHFTSEGIDHYSFEGVADYHGVISVIGEGDTNLPQLTDISFDVEGTWSGDVFTVTTLTIGGNIVYLATKKYVDDMLGGSTGGSSGIPYLYVSTVGMSTSNSVTLINNELSTISNYITNSLNKICEVAVKCNGATPGVLHSEEPLTGTETKIYLFGVNTTNTGSVVHNYKLSLQGSWSDGVFTATYGTVTRYVNIQKTDFLAKNNTVSFTPSTDYHPATKKYVDDMINALRSELSGS